MYARILYHIIDIKKIRLRLHDGNPVLYNPHAARRLISCGPPVHLLEICVKNQVKDKIWLDIW